MTTKEDIAKLAADPKWNGGFFTDLSIDDYHDSVGLSKSGLEQFRKSPASYQLWKNTPREETKALRLGKLFHHCLLEPETFSKVYRAKPDRQKRSNDDKAWWADFEIEVAANKQILADADQIETAMQMRDSLLKNDIVRRALIGAKEVSAYAREMNTGVLTKARSDIINAGGFIIDFKTTESVDMDDISRDIANYGYHRQNAMHENVINTAILAGNDLMVNGKKIEKVKNPLFLFAEKKKPFDFELVALKLDDVQCGFDEIMEDLTNFAKCEKENHWPTRGGKIKEIGLPKWYRRPVVV